MIIVNGNSFIFVMINSFIKNSISINIVCDIFVINLSNIVCFINVYSFIYNSSFIEISSFVNIPSFVKISNFISRIRDIGYGTVKIIIIIMPYR